MAAPNLQCAQQLLNALGYDVKVVAGIIEGSQPHRKAGTAIARIKTIDRQGDWELFQIDIYKYQIIQVKHDFIEGRYPTGH